MKAMIFRGLVLLVLASSVMGQAVQIDMTGGNYDAYITTYEATYCKDTYNDQPGDVLGEHHIEQPYGSPYTGATFAVQSEVDAHYPGQGLVGLPDNGVITTTYGTFQLATGSRDTGPFPPEDLARNTFFAFKYNSGDTYPATMMFKPGEQKKYNNINIVFEGKGTVYINALYDDGAGGVEEVLLFSGDVPKWTYTPPQSGFDQAGATCTAYWRTRYYQYTRCLSYEAEPVRLWTFSTPLTLDPDKTLMGLKTDVAIGSGTRALCIYGITAYEATGPGEPDSITASVIPETIADDGGVTATMTITVRDANQNLLGGLAGDITVQQTGGTGAASAGTIAETATEGIYEATITGTVAGDVVLTAYLNEGEGDELSDAEPDTVTVYDPDEVTQGTVVASPDQIPDDGTYGSVMTITLRNAVGEPVSGLADDLTVSQASGTGSALVGAVSETMPGTYEADVTGTGAGAVELSAVLYEGTAAELPIGSDTVTVFTPGANDYPMADAGSAANVTDTDRNGREEVTLDGSGSYDATGVTRYLWTVGGSVLYDTDYEWFSSVAVVEMPVGVFEVMLTVFDEDDHYHSDTVQVTVNPGAADDSVPLDLSAGFNYDAVGTADEVLATEGWYDYYLAVDINRLFLSGRVSRALTFAYTDDPWTGIAISPPDLEFYNITYQMEYPGGFPGGSSACYAHALGDANTVPLVAYTDYGTYQLGPWDAGAALADTTQYIMPAQPNCVVLGTRYGYFAADASDNPIEAGYAAKTVMLAPADQKHYDDVNFLLSGRCSGDLRGDPELPRRRSTFRIYALYQGEEATPVLLFESPTIYYDPAEPYGAGDPRNARNGGVPAPGGLSTDVDTQAMWDPAFANHWPGLGVAVGTKYYQTYGNGTIYGDGHEADNEKYSRCYAVEEGSSLWMWEVDTDGLALDSAKTLVGFTFEVDAGRYAPLSGDQSGDMVNIYAASAHVAEGLPLEVTAALAAGEDWVYQNTETTTADRHTSLATISLVSEASPGEVYDVSIADDGPGTNFTLGAVVDNRPGQQTLTVPIIGGRIGASAPGASGAAYTVTLTVEGQTSTQSDTADVTLALRYIGDVDGSGAPGAQDKQFFNQRLNNVATAYPDRCYDLNGSGGAPNAEDKQVMNQVLNGVSLP